MINTPKTANTTTSRIRKLENTTNTTKTTKTTNTTNCSPTPEGGNYHRYIYTAASPPPLYGTIMTC